MSDEQEHRGNRSTAGGGSGEPDATRQLPAVTEQAEPFGGPRSGDGAVVDAGRTEEMPRDPGAGRIPDGTLMLPAVGAPGEPTELSAPTELSVPTRPGTPIDATAQLPAAAPASPGARPPGGGDPVWSGRAEVRRPRPGQVSEPTPTDWVTAAPGEPARAWWMPIVVGIVVLILLGVLGYGIWLILQSTDRDNPVAPAVSAVPTTLKPSSAPTSTAPASTAATSAATTEPADVTIPALVGLSSADARRALARVGLAARLIYRPADAPVGTVIDSDPPEGRQVPTDTRVTLVIATAPTTAPSPSPSRSAATRSSGEPDDD